MIQYAIPEEIEDYDEIRVFFVDDSFTTFFVNPWDDIKDSIVEFCEDQGIPLNEIIDYQIISAI